MTFVLYHTVYLLFKSALRNHAMNNNVLVLTDTVGSVGSLSLDRRIPPEVVMYDMTGCRKIEPCASGLDGENKDAAVGSRLKIVHHLFALFDTASAMQKEGGFVQLKSVIRN